MHAMVVEEIGDFPIWREWPAAAPGPREVRLRIRAAALNFADLLMIEGRYQETPEPPFVPGMEVAGEVVAVGSEVARFAPGQRIAAFCGHGGMAEETTVSQDRCIALPDTMDFPSAAAFPVAYGTSHLALTRRANLRPGETLAVLGAAGGVGLTAVEIGKRLGARIIAIARGDEKLAVARAAGADVALDVAPDDLKAALRDHGPIDVVYDPVGGAAGEAAMAALAPEGRYVVIGFASGDLPRLRPNHMLVKNVAAIGFYWGGYLKFRPEALTESLAELVRWHEQGLIRPHVSHVLPVSEARAALDLLRSRKATGKVVLTP